MLAHRPTALSTWSALAVVVASLAGCAATRPADLRTGASYSTVPCRDNCGGDAQCLAQCQPAGNNPPPAALMGHPL